MIWRGLYLVGFEHRRQLLHGLTRQAIDYAALAGILSYELYYLSVYVFSLLSHLVIEVRTVEGTAKLKGIGYAEALLDVGAHLVRSGGSKSYNRRNANLVDSGSERAVVWTEVVAPLRDAVSLVYSIERYVERT